MTSALLVAMLVIAEPQPSSVDRLIAGSVLILAGTEGTGSGFIVDRERGWIITAAHVVGNAKRVEVFFPQRDGPQSFRTLRDDYLGHRELLRQSGHYRVGRVMQRLAEHDIALIEVDAMPVSSIALPLANQPPRSGESVRLIGHRRDVETLWNLTSGWLRQIQAPGEGYAVGGNRFAVSARLLMLQVASLQGDSGGPIVNAQGEIIGMLAATSGRVSEMAYGVTLDSIRAGFTMPNAEPRPPSGVAAIEDPELRATRLLAQAVVRVEPTATADRCAAWCVDDQRRVFLTTTAAIGNRAMVTLLAPRWRDGELIPDWSAYRDRLRLAQEHRWMRAVVIERDADSELAVLVVEAVPPEIRSLERAVASPGVGSVVQTMQHPLGIEAGWLMASGWIRQRTLQKSGGSLLLQLQTQPRASGSPIVSRAGQVVGMIQPREGSGLSLGYATPIESIQEILQRSNRLIDPQSIEDWAKRAKLCQQAGAWAMAEFCWRSALRQKPGDVTLRLHLAEVCLRQNRLTQAEAALQSLPVSADERAISAWLLAIRGDLPAARARAEESLKLDGQHSRGQWVMAWISLERNDITAANARITAHRQKHPDDADWRALQAESLAVGQDWSQAVTMIGTAIEQQPHRADWQRLRARWYLRLNEPKRAREDLLTLLNENPLDFDAHADLLPILLNLREDELAQSTTRDALRLAPTQLPQMATAWLAEHQRRVDAQVDLEQRVVFLVAGLQSCESGLPIPDPKRNRIRTALMRVAQNSPALDRERELRQILEHCRDDREKSVTPKP